MHCFLYKGFRPSIRTAPGIDGHLSLRFCSLQSCQVTAVVKLVEGVKDSGYQSHTAVLDALPLVRSSASEPVFPTGRSKMSLHHSKRARKWIRH